MKKVTIFFAISMIGLLFIGCFAKPQVITFTTEPYSYLMPAEDTLDLTTVHETNVYLSKVICADEETLDAGGPALQSAYSKPTDLETGTVFNLALDRLDKFEGSLCDLYVKAYDESTVEELESVLRVNIGEEVVVEEEVELCEDGTVCVDEEVVDGEVTEEDVVEEEVTEEVVEEEVTDEEVVEEEVVEEETEVIE